MTIAIVEVGWATSLQDRGRLGFAALGVPHAGPVDRSAHARVNRLVGNPAGVATLETAGGLVLEAVDPAIVASSSAGSRITLHAGQRLRIDPRADERWAYLAARGGFVADAVLGSVSQDSLSGLGPQPLRAGAVIELGDDPRTELVAELAPVAPRPTVARVWEGPRAHWFDGGVRVLTERRWVVGAEANRVGVRLTASVAADLAPGRWSEMASEGLVEGAIQIPPSGEAIVMLADHPTTGGYPVVGVVVPEDLAVVAQAVAGTRIEFRTLSASPPGGGHAPVR